MSFTTLFVLGSAVLAIVYGIVLIKLIMRLPSGNAKMKEIASAIQEGAKAYLNRQYRTVAIVAAVLFVVLGFIPGLGWMTAFAFLIGAFFSALAGYIGMNVSVRANVRTTEAARGGIGFVRHGRALFYNKRYPCADWFWFWRVATIYFCPARRRYFY